MTRFRTFMGAGCLLAAGIAVAAEPAAVITVDPVRRGGAASPRLYGQFIEHLGRCINGGLFDPGSRLADTNGFRTDVLEKVRGLNPPLVRWPGGTFTKIYHWQDGVGAPAERRRRPNLIWGGEEDNRFGTHEFIRYCRAIGAEPYISVNMGTGTAEEAANWVEYCNGTGTTYFAELRRRHGAPEPFNVKYWGLGNEEDAEPDCGRLQDPQVYAKEAWQFAKLMKLQDPSIRLIVAGCGDTNWNATVLASLEPVADYISCHWYFGTKDYGRLLDRVAAFDRQMGEWQAFLGRFPEKPEGFSHWYRFPPRQGPVKLAIDEWGLWNGGTAGREQLWGLEQTYTWGDALAVASWLNAMQRHADVIGFATWAQLVNVIAPIQADAKGSVRQTVYFPLELYRRHLASGSNVAATCTSPTLAGPGARPALDVVAVRDEQAGTLTLAVVNRDPAADIPARIEIAGGGFQTLAGGQELAAAALDAHNALTEPEKNVVQSRALPARADARTHTFPARSITLLILK